MPNRENQENSTRPSQPGFAARQTGGGAVEQGGASETAPKLLPSISVPKGGGAIRGIDEKFSVNPATGAGSLSIPFPVSPGRSNFAPQLALSYSSGTGNGPFGLGWDLSVPAITRKTDKGVPKYQDVEESEVAKSEVFVLSGAEDLVAALTPAGTKEIRNEGEYRIQRYRPRIEGLFARIEKWTRIAGHPESLGDVHWRATTKDNLTSIYGRSANSRIADSADPSHIFSWLLEESYDDKGNVIVYEYKPENSDGINPTLPQEGKRLRWGKSFANRYLKRVKYGNRTPNARDNWLFEVVLDYGEHAAANPQPAESRPWEARPDSFSTYRAGFEIRTYRLCRRVLMFHHFEATPYLVRSLELTYEPHPHLTYLIAATQKGYVKDGGAYRSKALPPLQFDYTRFQIDETIHDVDRESLENLPVGIDDANYQWVDLDGEGVSGVLSQQGEAWYYKRNLGNARFGPVERLTSHPAHAALQSPRTQFMDIDGNGMKELVLLDDPITGFYEKNHENGWEGFVAFQHEPNVDWGDPNLRMIDLTGDGFADILISNDDSFLYFPSKADEGFDAPAFIRKALDEEEGPALVFADRSQSIFLADMSGGGLTDIVRIRNGEVCYWPNLGYGRFGAKITMDHPPCFDHPDRFNPARLRLADIDGSGTTDIIYLNAKSIRMYLNQAGNDWSEPIELKSFPPVDNLASVSVIDLLGNGTACLVWSSPLQRDANRPMRYIALMGEGKPHLLNSSKNNLGRETRLQHASSTKFYLADRADGKPWATKLPFPVHVVERVETFDHVSRTKLVTRYRFHHGYFDGKEREFRGFGMVEQEDTESFAEFSGSGAITGAASNADAAFYLPPILTKTWLHTGAYFEKERLAAYFREREYYREDTQAVFLPDTILPAGLTPEEEREACRALKGSTLRQEIYALVDSANSRHPYNVSERAYKLRVIQPRRDNPHAVFYAYPCETIDYHYERNPNDPRLSHQMNLEVDDFGNVTKAAAIGYPRRAHAERKPEQEKTLVIYTENRVTNKFNETGWYRIGVPIETRTYEITGVSPAGRVFAPAEIVAAVARAAEIQYEATPAAGAIQKRLIERVRSLYCKNDLSGPLALGEIESLALPFESYKLAFTPGLLDVFRSKMNRAGLTTLLTSAEGGYKNLDGDGVLWIPSGRAFFSPIPKPTPNPIAQDAAFARAHFYLAQAAQDPFGNVSRLTYDVHDLLITQTEDAAGNVILAENDYRVLQPKKVTDPNGNRAQMAFDSLGMVVATAVMGKATETKGDSLVGLAPDLDDAAIIAHVDNPFTNPHDILQRATTRLVYDAWRYHRTKRVDANGEEHGEPVVVYTLARETHDADLASGQRTKIQHSFLYSDGFGREIQTKIQAEPMTGNTAPRWVGTGWKVYNNKGKPIKQYEPFFSGTHAFEFAKQRGVSPTLFYDPVERVVATLHPNHTYEKVVFDPWQQTTWDVNDTVTQSDPRNDSNVGEFFRLLDDDEFLPAWHNRRIGGGLGAAEQEAAQKAARHANTPTTAHLDTLGRPFLTIARNGLAPADEYRTYVELDIEGNQRAVTDALNRQVMRYDYNMLGNQIHQNSMDAGERWGLSNVAGKPLRAWDSRGHQIRTTYDQLQRPTQLFVRRGTEAEKLAERVVYGETRPDAVSLNLRGQVYQSYDTAGVVTNNAYDFKGNPLGSTRQLLRNYKDPVNWSASPELEGETFTSSTTFDALNRPIALTTPDRSVFRPSFNEANLLEQVNVNLRGAATATRFVNDIDYNEKGQRELIEYGNGVRTEYVYDPLTFRLTNLKTQRTTDNKRLQDLKYTYDPTGNITQIRDDAQQEVFFDNHRIEPHGKYEYDPLYRLTKAEGREHIGQASNNQPQHRPALKPEYDFNDITRRNLAHPHDGQKMQTYTQLYEYDAVGNILKLIHQAASGGFTRRYQYETNNNQLTSTSLPGDPATGVLPRRYTYDEHGNMKSMPHLREMIWNFKDQLQQVDLNGGGRAYYVYDAAGQRVRKVHEHNGATVEERIYLGGFEIYRKRNASGLVLERETLHVMDDQRRIALVETKTIENGQPATSNERPATRYQLDNHLGSACVEVDENGNVISYEEYHPYGTTSYQAGRNAAEVSLKRYRYTGMERDEETGLNYHTARYYAPWLGRWCAADPVGLGGGINMYCYSKSNPIVRIDRHGTNDHLIGVGGPEELRDPSRGEEARAYFTSLGFEVSKIEWNDEARRWNVWERREADQELPIDSSIGGLTPTSPGSTGGAQPIPVGSLGGRPSPQSTGTATGGDDPFADFDESDDDPIAGLDDESSDSQGTSTSQENWDPAADDRRSRDFWAAGIDVAEGTEQVLPHVRHRLAEREAQRTLRNASRRAQAAREAGRTARSRNPGADSSRHARRARQTVSRASRRAASTRANAPRPSRFTLGGYFRGPVGVLGRVGGVLTTLEMLDNITQDAERLVNGDISTGQYAWRASAHVLGATISVAIPGADSGIHYIWDLWEPIIFDIPTTSGRRGL